MKRKVFLGIEDLPQGQSSGKITDGCIVLEGGAFRGTYTEGVLDALLQEDINIGCVVGVSAGALNGMSYVSGQIGRSARVNLRYRHDGRFVGRRALRRNQGPIGFDFLFNTIEGTDPLDLDRFMRPQQRFVAVATNCLTGREEYFEKGRCSDIFRAIQASASMPYISKMVYIDGAPYLDGGCACKVAYQWALDQGYEKIVVVRTRTESYRKKPRNKTDAITNKIFYHAYPKLAQALEASGENYNRQCEELLRLRDEGRIYMISPSLTITVEHLESDMQKLGAWYYLGYEDMNRQMSELKAYLSK